MLVLSDTGAVAVDQRPGLYNNALTCLSIPTPVAITPNRVYRVRLVNDHKDGVGRFVYVSSTPNPYLEGSAWLNGQDLGADVAGDVNGRP